MYHSVLVKYNIVASGKAPQSVLAHFRPLLPTLFVQLTAMATIHLHLKSNGPCLLLRLLTTHYSKHAIDLRERIINYTNQYAREKKRHFGGRYHLPGTDAGW
jgi:hypothetical protein